ncbi:MAG: hypothetical protein IT190_05895 [Microbacteriaceae bacterium]|nr:hypothetical protein [Microbacteriaceae bacterium]
MTNRVLSDEERELLLRIIKESDVGAEQARSQVAVAHYAGPSHTGTDQCFDIHVDGEVELVPGPDGPRFGLVVYTDDEPTGMVDLWVAAGRLSSFEYSWFTEDEPKRLPFLHELRDQ